MSADLNITNEPAATGPSQLSELVDHILQQHNVMVIGRSLPRPEHSQDMVIGRSTENPP